MTRVQDTALHCRRSSEASQHSEAPRRNITEGRVDTWTRGEHLYCLMIDILLRLLHTVHVSTCPPAAEADIYSLPEGGQDKYDLLEEIGQGTYGLVHRCASNIIYNLHCPNHFITTVASCWIPQGSGDQLRHAPRCQDH